MKTERQPWTDAEVELLKVEWAKHGHGCAHLFPTRTRKSLEKKASLCGVRVDKFGPADQVMQLVNRKEGMLAREWLGGKALIYSMAYTGKIFTTKKRLGTVPARYFATQELADEYYATHFVKAPAPITLLQPKPVNREKAARERWAEQVAIRPDGVKVTQCPGFTGASRFAPAPDSHGAGFKAEWDQLRRSA
jgi:hypothetical protein